MKQLMVVHSIFLKKHVAGLEPPTKKKGLHQLVCCNRAGQYISKSAMVCPGVKLIMYTVFIIMNFIRLQLIQQTPMLSSDRSLSSSLLRQKCFIGLAIKNHQLVYSEHLPATVMLEQYLDIRNLFAESSRNHVLDCSDLLEYLQERETVDKSLKYYAKLDHEGVLDSFFFCFTRSTRKMGTCWCQSYFI